LKSAPKFLKQTLVGPIFLTTPDFGPDPKNPNFALFSPQKNDPFPNPKNTKKAPYFKRYDSRNIAIFEKCLKIS